MEVFALESKATVLSDIIKYRSGKPYLEKEQRGSSLLCQDKLIL